jgi:hypothetical protein
MNRTNLILLLATIIGGAASFSRAATPPEPLPTANQAHQEFTDGKYREAIKSISKIAASREWQAKQFDKHDLLLLKGEAHLKLKESAAAAAAFEAASKETTDKPAAAVAHMTSILIKKCIGTHFIPKATADKRIPGKSPTDRLTIDIVEPEMRKEALLALWQDERNAAEVKIKPATEGESVQPAIDAAPMVLRLHDYDFAAHGNDNDTNAAAGLIAAHARDLLGAMLEKMGIRVDEISTKAAKVEKFRAAVGRGQSQDIWRKHGLDGNEPNELKDILAKAEKIPIAVKLLNDGLMPGSGFFDKMLADSKRVMEKAEKALNDNYAEINPAR